MMLGEDFAGYRVLELLGSGGFASVYRAEDPNPHLQRMVALKILHPTQAGDPAVQERFLRESRAAAALNHPNIVPVYSAGEHDGRHYLAMQFVEGPDLGTLVEQRGSLPLAELVPVLTGIASALDAAHARGIVHRDVKGGNILLRADLQHAYLTDFGLVKRPEREHSLTGVGSFLGTLDYMAPEQIEGRQVGPTTDTYSLGCVVFECLTGRAPFAHTEGLGVLTAHLTHPPPAVSTHRPDLPAGLDEVLFRALAKDPANRPACGELAAAVAALATGDRSPGPPPAPGRGDDDRHGTRVVTGPPAGDGSSNGDVATAANAPRRPVVLAAAAALVVALAVAAWAVSSTDGSGEASVEQPGDTDAQPVSDEEAKETENLDLLLGRVPTSIRQSCDPFEPDPPALAGVDCVPASATDKIRYVLFDTVAEMNTDYLSERRLSGVEPDSGSCADDIEAESNYQLPDTPRAGRLLCYQEDGVAWITWTNTELRILAFGRRTDGDHGALFDWWNNAGPVHDAD